MITYLESKGYKIQRPPKEINDEYTFDNAWNLYEKKVGCKEKLRKKWNSMTKADRKAATEYIPLYVISTPERQYRKNFQTFLNQRGWEDELIGEATPPTQQAEPQQSEISKLIEKTEANKVNWTKEAKDHALRQRIYGLISYIKESPNSLCSDLLRQYYNNGTMERLHIDWKP